MLENKGVCPGNCEVRGGFSTTWPHNTPGARLGRAGMKRKVRIISSGCALSCCDQTAHAHKDHLANGRRHGQKGENEIIVLFGGTIGENKLVFQRKAGMACLFLCVYLRAGDNSALLVWVV